MIQIEFYSDGRSKLIYGDSKSVLKTITTELLREKYEDFLPKEELVDYIFHTPEMHEGRLLIKVTIDVKKNIFSHVFEVLGSDLLKLIKDWFNDKYGEPISIKLEIITSNHRYFFS